MHHGMRADVMIVAAAFDCIGPWSLSPSMHVTSLTLSAFLLGAGSEVAATGRVLTQEGGRTVLVFTAIRKTAFV